MMHIDFDTMRRALRKPFNRRVGLAAGVVVAGAVGLLALESRSGSVPMPDKAACCSSAVAIGDAMMSPAVGGDKDFFEVPSSPPSAMFLLGNNESMMDYPQYLPEAFTPGYDPPPATPVVGDRGYDGDYGNFVNTGCSDPALTGAMSWFDKDSADTKKNGSVIYDNDADFNPTPFFEPNKFYHSRGRRIAWQVGEFPYSLSAFFTTLDGTTDTLTACFQVVGWTGAYWNSPVMNECQSCLANKGWWRGPMISAKTQVGYNGPTRSFDEPPLPPEAYRKWIVSGRVLNLRPPKFVVARKVLKDVINMAPNVRMGVATFGKDHGWFDPPQILANLSPTCDKSYPTINEAALNRPKLMSAVNKALFRHNERAIGEALFGLGGYFSSQISDNKWENWFKQPLNPGYFGWPGCCNGGTYDNPYTGQTGATYAAGSDEWVKKGFVDPSTGEWRPGQPWEIDPLNELPDVNKRSVCFGCQVSSVIVLTDGAPKYDNSVPITKMMELLVAKGARHPPPDGSLVKWNPANPETNPDVGGINYCDQFADDSGVKYTKADCDYTDWNWPTGLGVGNKNFMDDVAFFLANMDLRDDMPGTQSVRTYTIGYGDNSVMLQSIAKAGKGTFTRVNEPEELRNAIINALGDLKQLSTSFAAANISGVQASGVQSSVYVPRFIPRRNRPYEGHLYRFFYYSEFAQGCVPHGPTDLNDDGDCDDSFYVDGTGISLPVGVPLTPDKFSKDNIVQENTEGVWVRVNTATPVDGGKVEGGTPAQPFWDVGEKIGKRQAAQKCNPNLRPGDAGYDTSGRCIFTLIDRNDDGKFTSEDNPPVEFHEDNLAQLKKYVLAGGDAFCSTLFAKQKKGTWSGTPAQQDYCATQLIRFVRGMDVFDYDGDSILDEERPCADNAKADVATSCKLADIFHSTPVVVDPPVEPFLCDNALSGQCVSTLYNLVGGIPTPKATPMDPAPNYSAGNYGAYSVHKAALEKRDRILLVGSNGGMIHAIHAGSATSAAKKGKFDDIHDIGTGQELWAFIPPDLLPKLGLMVGGHEYFVDGTPMVRDIWADGTGGTQPGVKEPGEFRTIAVTTERGGGQRFVALDVTDPYMMLNALKDPSDKNQQPFRWMFPNACDKESVTMGQSWSNFAPRPPPIGPVRLKAGSSSAPNDIARGWEERWIVALNGGYSPDLTRGRGVYLVDAWTGQKLWSAEAQPMAKTGAYDEVLNQMMPVVASPAMVDIGKGDSVQLDADGFFDTMIVGDMGGQVWTFRFHEPGERDATTKQVNNWFGARSLEMAREDGYLGGPHSAYQKAAFFQIASTIRQPETGWLRAFMGTGDRQHLRTTPGTDCSADDLLACLRLKCNVEAKLVGEINGQKRTSTLKYVGGVLTASKEDWTSTGTTACSGSRMELTQLTISCPDPAYGSGVYPPTLPSDGKPREFTTESSCSGSGSLWTCNHLNLNTAEHADMKLSSTEQGSVALQRFFGFQVYGSGGRAFNTAAGAVSFDQMRLTDTAGFKCADGSPCSLVDVTIPDSLYKYLPPDAAGVKQRYITAGDLSKVPRANEFSPGWFVRYNNSLLERTAEGSTVLAGVVFWPSFAPSSGVGSAACSLAGLGDMSYSWQADVITGLPNLAESFQKFDVDPMTGKRTLVGYIDAKARPTSGPPGSGMPIVSLSATGAKRFEVAMSSPGEAPSTENLKTQENKAPEIYWLEVPRNLHSCRHENAANCTQ
ncbi:hypothetical protein [Vitiosangium sp. GDMCC 1.1324]|uniref:hypothetical protein n=1 Tax=Vitiosangium sp. (strain GDMCC 1.1324) TaxID=2138576 RepID=UPI000D3CF938|nr:hypothetical protein [Vitiosangium sp. GDMCC 1.1324]PTL82257.1 hypothetical protein DAT35_20935 [Vitiosangium sp. GDMCC 1.1324]